jgi:phosphoglycerate dehydrogenase-like enzyme
MKIALIDDSQHIALASADWGRLQGRADVVVRHEPFASEDDAAAWLRPFDIIVPMRERTAFTASLLARLPNLKLIAQTGVRAPTLDMAACKARGVTVCNTGGDNVGAATSEIAWALIMACSRDLAFADAGMRAGLFHEEIVVGSSLAGRRLGVVGLGKLGQKVAAYGRAFGMEVVAWSQNLTAEAADAAGARLVSKPELFAQSDVISLHLVLSERTRGVVGAAEVAALKPGAILVNSSRGPLIDHAALLARLDRGDIWAGLDVFDAEPPPLADPLRTHRRVVLSPHLGYSTQAVFRQFYGESLENIAAFLDGAPIRVISG